MGSCLSSESGSPPAPNQGNAIGQLYARGGAELAQRSSAECASGASTDPLPTPAPPPEEAKDVSAPVSLQPSNSVKPSTQPLPPPQLSINVQYTSSEIVPASPTSGERPRHAFGAPDSCITVYAEPLKADAVAGGRVASIPHEANIPSASVTPAGNALLYLNRAMIYRNRAEAGGVLPPLAPPPFSPASASSTEPPPASSLNTHGNGNDLKDRLLREKSAPAAPSPRPPSVSPVAVTSAAATTGLPRVVSMGCVGDGSSHHPCSTSSLGPDATGDSGLFDSPGAFMAAAGPFSGGLSTTTNSTAAVTVGPTNTSTATGLTTSNYTTHITSNLLNSAAAAVAAAAAAGISRGAARTMPDGLTPQPQPPPTMATALVVASGAAPAATGGGTGSAGNSGGGNSGGGLGLGGGGPLLGQGLEATLGEMQQMALIGSGGGGCVYIGRWRGVTVAIKCIVSSTDDQLVRSQREALLSRLASHPHVVQTYATSVTQLTEAMFKASTNSDPQGGFAATDPNISHDILAGITSGSWIRGELQAALQSGVGQPPQTGVPAAAAAAGAAFGSSGPVMAAVAGGDVGGCGISNLPAIGFGAAAAVAVMQSAGGGGAGGGFGAGHVAASASGGGCGNGCCGGPGVAHAGGGGGGCGGAAPALPTIMESFARSHPSMSGCSRSGSTRGGGGAAGGLGISALGDSYLPLTISAYESDLSRSEDEARRGSDAAAAVAVAATAVAANGGVGGCVGGGGGAGVGVGGSCGCCCGGGECCCCHAGSVGGGAGAASSSREDEDAGSGCGLGRGESGVTAGSHGAGACGGVCRCEGAGGGGSRGACGRVGGGAAAAAGTGATAAATVGAEAGGAASGGGAAACGASACCGGGAAGLVGGAVHPSRGPGVGAHPGGAADSFDASFVRDHLGRTKYSTHEVLRQLGALEGQFLTMVVMEYCDGGSLLAALKEGPFNRDTTSWSPRMLLRSTVRTALEVAHGMQHLHLSGLVHGDLKPGNVLLKGSNQDKRKFVAKVSDLGTAHPVGTGDEMAIDDGQIGSIAYMAPEVFRGRVMKASDVYSFGVLLWQLTSGTGAAPYEGAHPMAIALGVSEGKLSLRWPSGVFRPLQQLGELCTQPDPAARPSFKSVVGALEKLERHMQRLATTGGGSSGAIAAGAAGMSGGGGSGSMGFGSPPSSTMYVGG
ncbi:hypothetical protein Agub_g13046, partial [Astrephomene gubernaculifera]